MARRQKSPIQATTLNEATLNGWITDLARPRSENAKGGRFGKLHELITLREHHFHASQEADPKLQYPHDQVAGFQSDLPRQTWVSLKARITENPFRFRVTPPRDTPKMRERADKFEKVLNIGFEALQDRERINIQGDLADGQIVDCYGVLHIQKATDIWPSFPDGLTLNDDPGDTVNFREEDGKWVETESSKQDRDRRAKAKAGFPWYVEVIHPSMFSFVEDRSVANGMAIALVLRSVPMLEYEKKIAESDKLCLSLNDEKTALKVFQEKERPADNDPSIYKDSTWDAKCFVAEVWTRDECYELVAPGGMGVGAGKYTLVKSFPHPYGMPPFALATADHFNTPDPAYRYRPAMDGIFRVKPFFDRDITLGRAIAEQTALPLYYIKMASGEYMTDEQGKQLVLTKNALAAQVLPPGAEIVSISPDMGDAFIKFLEVTGNEMRDAAPETGTVDVGASTAPWTIRLAQDQANAYPRQLISAQADALKTIGQIVLRVAQLPAADGGIGQPMWMYDEKGELIGLDPSDLNGMELDVDINPTSNSQQIAQVEHGRTLLADENFPITPEIVLSDYAGVENVTERMEAWIASKTYREKFQPSVIDQKLSEYFGAKFYIAPGGVPVGMGGEPLDPTQALQRKGITVSRPQAQMAGAMQGIAPPVVNDLQPLNGPGVTPTYGQPGAGSTM